MRQKMKVENSGGYEWVQTLVCTILPVILLCTFVVRLVGVDGRSMQNTLQHKDQLLVLSGWLCGAYHPGDIVVAAEPGFENGKPIVKRVIAVGGQTVDIDFESGTVYVDGAALEEPYIKEPTWTEEGVSFPLTLGENELFLMGDNRNRSTDSRSPDLGPVDSRSVIGKAFFLVLPGETEATGKREWERIGILN